jgi:hypothetical protein
MAITLTGATKLITLDTDETFTASDIYAAAVEWAMLEANMQFLLPMESAGHSPLGGSVYTDIIYILCNGWKITSSGYAAGTEIAITGTLITDDTTTRVTLGDSSVLWVFQVATYGSIAETTPGLTLAQFLALK